MFDKAPNKGIGDWLIVSYLGVIGGFIKFGIEWYGLKALLFGWVVVSLYALLTWIVSEIADLFKG
jgi:hypothetical protein